MKTVHGGPAARRPRQWAGVLTLAVAVIATASCGLVTPSTPTTAQWRTETEHAVSEAASALATARIVLIEADRGHFLGRAAQVILSETRAAAVEVEDAFSRLDPPPQLTAAHASVRAQLHAAVTGIAEAQSALRRHEDLTPSVSHLATARQRLTQVVDDLAAQ